MSDNETQESAGAEALFPQTVDRPVRKRHRGLAIGIVITVIVALIVVLIVVDGAARGLAEERIENEVSSRLPAGASEVTATIGGNSFLTQFFAGSLEQLNISFAVDGDALGALTNRDDATIGVEDGVLTYDGSIEFFGLSVGYTVDLEPSVDGGYVVLNPTAVHATSGDASIDLAKFLKLEELTMRVCAAELLPEGMELSSVKASGSTLKLEVVGNDIPLDVNALKTRGTCV